MDPTANGSNGCDESFDSETRAIWVATGILLHDGKPRTRKRAQRQSPVDAANANMSSLLALPCSTHT